MQATNLRQCSERLTPVFHGLACLLLLLAGCNQPVVQSDPVPEHDELSIDSIATSETRIINVYLPPKYSEGTTAYPVVYMPDGGIKEDFPHIANTLERLVQQGAISPVILVGVENTNRQRDLTGKSAIENDYKLLPDGGGSANFRKFFRDELRPEIEKRYRCNGETAMVGESLAGLFVVETLIVEPDLFSRYIAFDPSLWWNDSELASRAETAVEAETFSTKYFWMASSDADGMAVRTQELEQVLQSKAAPGMQVKYTQCPAEQHSTIFRAQKENAFQWALWKP